MSNRNRATIVHLITFGLICFTGILNVYVSTAAALLFSSSVVIWFVTSK